MTDPAADTPAPASRGWRVPSSAWYLSYLAIMLFQPLGSPDTGVVEWVVLAVVWAVYIPLYLVAETRPGWIQDHADVLSLVIGLLAMPFNGGASVLLVYAAAYAASSRPRPVAVRWFVGLSLVLALASWLAVDIPLPFRILSFLPAGVFVWVVGWQVLEEVEREREASRLRVDNARIEHLATVNERERIARDLHDLLGHTLTSVVVRAQLVKRLASSDPDRAAAEGAAIEEAAREALSEVRRTVQGWRQASLDDELTSARAALEAADIELIVDRDEVPLAPSVEAAFALALREAVTNVVRHAGARRCHVQLRSEVGEVSLVVTDDGRGSKGPEGQGLSGMRERISALGGHVERRGVDGTSLRVAVPLEVAG